MDDRDSIQRWIDSPPTPRWLSVLSLLVGAVVAAGFMLAFFASGPF